MRRSASPDTAGIGSCQRAAARYGAPQLWSRRRHFPQRRATLCLRKLLARPHCGFRLLTGNAPRHRVTVQLLRSLLPATPLDTPARRRQQAGSHGGMFGRSTRNRSSTGDEYEKAWGEEYAGIGELTVGTHCSQGNEHFGLTVRQFRLTHESATPEVTALDSPILSRRSRRPGTRRACTKHES